jgi:hypothetical protein
VNLIVTIAKILLKMEDKIIFLKMEDNLNNYFWKIEVNLNVLKMEDDLIFFENEC